jgi:tetratricopeptide (TPR) repeat protein
MRSAQENLRRGNVKRAVQEYVSAVESAPDDMRTRHKLADLLIREGRHAEAMAQLRTIGDYYLREGFSEKALAVFQQALRIDHTLPQLHASIGEASFLIGRLKDALRSYRLALRYYQESEDGPGQRETLTRMIDIDTDDMGLGVQLAELLLKQGLRDESLERFRAVARTLEKNQELDSYLQVAERIIYLGGPALAERKRIAEVYLDRGKNTNALRHLQKCFQSDPDDAETLDLLASTFRAMDNITKAVMVYLELASFFEKEDRLSEAEQVFEQILALVPDHVEAGRGLQRLSDGVGPETGHLAPTTDSLPASANSERDPLDFGNDFLAFAEEAIRSVEGDADLDGLDVLPGSASSGALAGTMTEPTSVDQGLDPVTDSSVAQGGEAVDVLAGLAELEVFTKYSLVDQADGLLQRLLRAAPDDVRVMEARATLLESRELFEDASSQLIVLAGMVGAAKGRDVLIRARKLTGDPARIDAIARSLKIDLDDRDDIPDISNDLVFLEPDEEQEPELQAQEFEELEVLEIGVDNDFDIDESSFVELDDEDVEFDEFKEQISIHRNEGKTFYSTLFSEVETVDSLAIEADDPDGVLAEIDYFIQQGFVAAAREALQDVDAKRVNRTTLELRKQQVHALQHGVMVDPGAQGAHSLSKQFTPRSLASMSSTGSLESAELNTHFELGNTYQDMGLFEDAISEFTKAMTDRTCHDRAMLHIATCHIELDRGGPAAEQLALIVDNLSIPEDIREEAQTQLDRIEKAGFGL